MGPKKGASIPKGYYNYTVYPLEGIWDLNEEARATFDGEINKDDLIFNLMIRQPDFVDEFFFQEMLEFTKDKRPKELLARVDFQEMRMVDVFS